MSATDELRRLLDERGVEWESKDVEGIPGFHDTRWNAYDVRWCYVEFVGNNYTKLVPSSEFHCTPEQVIAMTLGGGKLTADNIRDLIEHHSDASAARLAERLRGIADEMRNIGASTMTPHELLACYAREVDKVADSLMFAATLGNGTCENVNTDGYGFYFECSECGYSTIVHNCAVRLDELPKFCPECGCKVRKAVVE